MEVVGHIDLCKPELIEGWISLNDDTKCAPRLQVFVDDQLLGDCVADGFRSDLRDNGYGDGSCAFSFRVPADYVVKNIRSCRLRLAGTVLYMLPDAYTVFANPASLAERRGEGVVLLHAS